MSMMKSWLSIRAWLGRFRNRLLKRAGHPRPQEDEQRINVRNDIIVGDLIQNPLDQAAAEIKHLEDVNQLHDLSRLPGADLLYPVCDSSDMEDTIIGAAYSTSGSWLQHEEGGGDMKQEEQKRAPQTTSDSASEKADWLDEDRFRERPFGSPRGPHGPFGEVTRKVMIAVYECPNHGEILPQEVLWKRGQPYCPHDKCQASLERRLV